MARIVVAEPLRGVQPAPGPWRRTRCIGTVDLYLTSHHGLEKSGSPALVQALRPRVVVMNNGTRKGGTPEVFAGLQETVGIEDLWQLHWSHNAGLENAPARFIANIDEPATIATILTAPPPAPGLPPAAREYGRAATVPGCSRRTHRCSPVSRE